MAEIDHLKEKLIKLRLKGMAHHLEAVLKEAAQKNLDFLSTFNRLADIELEQRCQNTIASDGDNPS